MAPTEKRIAILTTSEIWREDRGEGRTEENAVATIHRKEYDCPCWSTGILEKALRQGYTVLVASTRANLYSHDEWWLKLVGQDNVFLADGQSTQIDDSLSCNAHYEDLYSSGWRRLFDHLGEEWPKRRWMEDGVLRTGGDMCWTQARSWLQEHADYKWDHDFEDDDGYPAPKVGDRVILTGWKEYHGAEVIEVSVNGRIRVRYHADDGYVKRWKNWGSYKLM